MVFLPTTRAVIFANGGLPNPEAARNLIRPDDLLVAADGGSRHALAMGLYPSVVVGDMDSLSNEAFRVLTQRGATFLRFPPEKDETDLELALRYAREQGCRAILIVAGFGGRNDQTLGNLALLADPSLDGLDVRMDDGVEQAFFIRARADIAGKAGETVSLLPWGGPVDGIITAGLRYPLRGERLDPFRTRGISNEMLGATASVSIKSGVLLCLHRRND